MGTLFMPDWYSHYIYLIAGVISFSGAVVSAFAGKTRARFGGWVYRAKAPKEFWWVVAIYYVAGVLFIGTFLLN
jgi:hypothetical protein